MEKIVQEFPLATIVGNGNFTFGKHFTRNLYNYHGFIVPFHKKHPCRSNTQLSIRIFRISACVERVFLLKNVFLRFSTRWERSWQTMIQYFHVCCAIHNMLVTEMHYASMPNNMENYFVRVAKVEVSDDDEEDNQQLQNFPIHALRARLLRGQTIQDHDTDSDSHHLSAPYPPRILPYKDPLGNFQLPYLLSRVFCLPTINLRIFLIVHPQGISQSGKRQKFIQLFNKSHIASFSICHFVSQN